jgi:hypothetical protein
MSHYISNKEFTSAIVEYIEQCALAEQEGKEIPQIPNSIARQFMALANKLGSRYNFAGYTFRDEMVSNAILACCTKIRKFDIRVSSNAFAYFTNVCWRAMVDVINYEEKMSYIKAKSFSGVDFDEMMQDVDINDFVDPISGNSEFIPFFDVEEFEKKMQNQKDKAKAKSIEKNLLSNDYPMLDVD